jgi:Fe-S-cluster-containing dehydrogenase component
MPKYGLLIEYEYCTGCHTCEVACKQEHGYPVGIGGIHLNEIITNLANGKIRIDYIPFPTAQCDLCMAITKKGEKPSCVKHCQASCMWYGDVSELAKDMQNKTKSVMFAPN